MEPTIDNNKVENLQVKYYCKLNNCRSTILNKNIGDYKLMDLPNNWPINVNVNNYDGKVKVIQLGSMMDFDNVGVSKTVESKNIDYRFLTCADCDQGPIGYLIYPEGPAFLFCELCKIQE